MMKSGSKQRRLVSIVGALFVFLLVFPMALTASGAREKAPADEVRLVLWHQEQPAHRVQRFREIFDAFMKEYPQIKFEQQVQTWGEAYARTMSAIQARRQPDLLFTTPDFTGDIKRSGAVKPVDNFISRLSRSYTIYDQSLNPYRFEGHYWAVPLFGMNQLLYYRLIMVK